MKVILLRKMLNLGNIGDIKEVRDGFARNYLIPSGIATYDTSKNREMLNSILERAKKEDQKKHNEALAIHHKINNQSIVLIRQAALDGRLFGSVKSHDIAKSLDVSHRCVSIKQPIKYTGSYQISIVLHPEVIANVSLVVAISEADAEKILANENADNPTNDLS